MKWISRFCRWTGTGLALLGVLVYLTDFSAVPVVLDVPLIALVLSGLALAFITLGLVVAPKPLHRTRKGLVLRTLLIGALVVISSLCIHERYFTYQSESISFSDGAIKLAGTLYLPDGPGPYPSAVMVHGSGPESRAEYAYYAKLLARHGIAGLAYDKRGVGASTGKLYGTDYRGYASDAAAGVRALRQRPDMDSARVGLVGFSEGEWVAPLAATQLHDVAFVVIIGASGVSPAQQVNAEIESRLRSRGYDEAEIAKALELNNRVFEYQRTGKGRDDLASDLRRAASKPWFRDAGDIPTELYPVDDYAWWRSVMDFDPGPVWAQVSAPVLVLKGGRDAHSPAGQARRMIGAALCGSPRQAPADFALFPNADHLLLEWPLGKGTPPPVFADGYRRTLIGWISAVVNGQPGHSAIAPSATVYAMCE